MTESKYYGGRSMGIDAIQKKLRRGKKKPNGTGKNNSKSILKTSSKDIDKIKKNGKIIDDYLTFLMGDSEDFKLKRKNRDFDKKLYEGFHSSFLTWRELVGLRDEYDNAEIVLAAYFQKDKIKDNLEKVSECIDAIDSESDPYIVKLEVFNNYLYFSRHYIHKMKDVYKKREDDFQPPVQNGDINTVMWFINEECSTVVSLRELPKAYEAKEHLLKELKAGNMITDQQKEYRMIVSESVEFLAIVSEDDILEMNRISKSLCDRVESMKNNIETAKLLYSALIDCFTDEWFDTMNPESSHNILSGLSNQQLKDVYLSKINEFYSRIIDVHFQ